MILEDGKQIQGIFVYDDNAQYTLGDFIVEEDCMYICKSGSPVSGKVPSENPDYFSAYPGEMVADIEEYKKYLSDPINNKDKYISASVLSGILQEAYTGFGDSGVITDYLLLNGEGEIDACLRGQRINLGNDRPLDVVMRQEDMNNAYLVVDRNLPELSNLLASDENYDNEGANDVFSNHQCILRQYTYQDFDHMGIFDDSGIYTKYHYRVQELLDYKFGQVLYRYTVGTLSTLDSNWNFDNVISDWRSTSINPGLVSKMDEILNYYNREMSSNTSNNSSISNSSTRKFNFSEAVINQQSDLYSVNIYRESSSQTTVAKLPDDAFSNPFIITVCIVVPLTIGTTVVNRSYTLTFDIWDGSTTEYYLSDSLRLQRVRNDNGGRRSLFSYRNECRCAR